MLKEIRGIKKPGVVFHHLSKLGANEPQDLSETDGAVPLVTAASAARAVLWPAYPKGKHPLDAVNSAMKEYVRWLDGDMKQQKGNLAERSKGDARGLLGDASATLLVQWLGPGILGVGMEKQVFDLMNAIWVYAVPRDTKNIDLRKFARDAAARPLEGVKANSGFKAREILAVK
jgi:hypothetical protein